MADSRPSDEVALLRLARQLFAHHPQDRAAQRLFYAAAQCAPTAGGERTRLLQRLAERDDLDPELVDALSRDTNTAVRAKAWARPEWSVVQVAAMLAREKSQQVRAAALANPNLDAATYAAAAEPLERSFEMVLRNAAHLPATQVAGAIVAIGMPETVRSDLAVDAWRAAVRRREVAQLLLTDPRVTDRRLLTLAATAPDLPADQLTGLLEQWLEAWPQKSESIPKGGQSEGVSVFRHLRSLLGRKDLHPEVLRTAAKLVAHLTGELCTDLLREAANREMSPQKRAAQWFSASTLSSVTSLAGRVRSLPEEDWSHEHAALVVRARVCTVGLLERVRGYLDDPSEAGLAALVAADPGPRVWMADFPDLLVEHARTAPLPYDLAPLLRERPDTVRALLEDYAARPSAWSSSPWPTLLNWSAVPDGWHARCPSQDVVHLLRGDEDARHVTLGAVMDAVAAAVTSSGVLDVPVVELAARARMLRPLACSAVPTPVAVEALAASLT